jgi:hypothetical protein
MREKPIEKGSQIGNWIVLNDGEKDKNGNTVFRCKCQCGNIVGIRVEYLSGNKVKSCGCMNIAGECTKSGRHRINGLTGISEYSIWSGMIRRCTKTDHPRWNSYGGRGITVCPEWMGDNGFVSFLKDIGPRPSQSHTLDRINNSLGYERNNVRWADAYTQVHNRRKLRDLSTYSDKEITDELKRRNVI